MELGMVGQKMEERAYHQAKDSVRKATKEVQIFAWSILRGNGMVGQSAIRESMDDAPNHSRVAPSRSS